MLSCCPGFDRRDPATQTHLPPSQHKHSRHGHERAMGSVLASMGAIAPVSMMHGAPIPRRMPRRGVLCTRSVLGAPGLGSGAGVGAPCTITHDTVDTLPHKVAKKTCMSPFWGLRRSTAGSATPIGPAPPDPHAKWSSSPSSSETGRSHVGHHHRASIGVPHTAWRGAAASSAFRAPQPASSLSAPASSRPAALNS